MTSLKSIDDSFILAPSQSGVNVPLSNLETEDISNSNTFHTCTLTLQRNSSENENSQDVPSAISQHGHVPFVKNLFISKPWLFPLIYICIVPLFWITLFIIGLFRGFKNPFWAWKLAHGDNGKAIFSGCFAIWSDICGFLIIITSYLRFCQLNHYIKTSFCRVNQQISQPANACAYLNKILLKLVKMRKYNEVSLYFGYIAGVAFIMAGNFCFTQSHLYDSLYLIYLFFFLFNVCLQVDVIQYLEKKFQTEKKPHWIFCFALVLCSLFSFYIVFFINSFVNDKLFTNFSSLLWLQLASGTAIWAIFIGTYKRMKGAFLLWSQISF